MKARAGTMRWGLELAALGAVVVVALALLVPMTTGRGPDMDEGATLAYADRVLDGAFPHRDFLTYYGPASSWIVAAAFGLFGHDIVVERGVGLLYRLLVVLGLFVVARRIGGLVAGVLAGVTAVVLMADEVVWAYATYGSIAFALVGLALATTGAAAAPGRGQNLFVLAGGVAAGLATLVRFDFAPAIVASAVPLLLFLTGRARLWYAGGFLATAGLYIPYLVLVGPDRIEQIARDMAASGESRRLPIPSPWSLPGNLLAAALIGTAALVVVGAILVGRDRRALAGRVALSAGLLSVGLMPYAVSRLDLFHIIPVAIVPLGLAPALAVLLAESRWTDERARRVSAGCIVAATLALVVYFGEPEVRELEDPPRITNAGRVFYVDDDSLAVQQLVTELERRSRDGELLFVGPQDLRQADYNVTYLYHLLPKLEPASYYLELNPNTATTERSDLADELRRADWLILTSEFQGEDWWGPNPVFTYGPAEPNEVVRDRFCLRLESGEYRLYERCDRAPA